MDIQIRSSKIEDIEQIQKMSQLLFAKEQKEYDSLYNIDWTFSEKGIEYFSKALNDNDKKIFVPEIDGVIVGYLAAKIYTDDEYKKEGKDLRIAQIDSLMVLEEYRSQGIGKKLIDAFEVWAKENSAGRITVLASSPNERGIDFYKKQGFEIYEVGLKKDF